MTRRDGCDGHLVYSLAHMLLGGKILVWNPIDPIHHYVVRSALHGEVRMHLRARPGLSAGDTAMLNWNRLGLKIEGKAVNESGHGENDVEPCTPTLS